MDEEHSAAQGESIYGCEHYRRRCKLRAPCCNQIFSCRHCHNETTTALTNPKERHELDRHEVKHVIVVSIFICVVYLLININKHCLSYSLCACMIFLCISRLFVQCAIQSSRLLKFVQIVELRWGNTTVIFASSMMTIPQRGNFIVMTVGSVESGGRENYFHCRTCGACYPLRLRGGHSCVENSMKSPCSICYEFLFDSIKVSTIMKCGHTMHMACYEEMVRQNQYRCPICSKSVFDMSRTWRRLEREIRATPVPEEYRYEVPILCIDCDKTSNVRFHVLGRKCCHCESFNTRVVNP